MINYVASKKVSPRRYNLGKRQAAAAQNRHRVVEAARQLLSDQTSTADLSMEAVARKADVSRLTIYYQFRSRPGLLEALYDHLAARGGMHRIAEVFEEADPSKMLEKMVQVFVGFWASDPIVIRRLRAMSELDTEIAAGIHSRDSRRSHISGEIVRRFVSSRPNAPTTGEQTLAADALSMLTSFETFDALSRAGHGEEQIRYVVLHLAQAMISSL
jgi:AcrR family transcriptional regulator